MKKFTALFLAAVLIFSMSTAGAVVLRSLRETQDFLMKFSPNTMTATASTPSPSPAPSRKSTGAMRTITMR